MANLVSGTFSTTGNSDIIHAAKLSVSLIFAGTATVNLQWRLDGENWRTHTAYTASAAFTYDGPPTEWRLNCSAHTNDVNYAMRA